MQYAGSGAFLFLSKYGVICLFSHVARVSHLKQTQKSRYKERLLRLKNNLRLISGQPAINQRLAEIQHQLNSFYGRFYSQRLNAQLFFNAG